MFFWLREHLAWWVRFTFVSTENKVCSMAHVEDQTIYWLSVLREKAMRLSYQGRLQLFNMLHYSLIRLLIAVFCMYSWFKWWWKLTDWKHLKCSRCKVLLHFKFRWASPTLQNLLFLSTSWRLHTYCEAYRSCCWNEVGV